MNNFKLDKTLSVVGIFITAGIGAVLSTMLTQREIDSRIDEAIAERERKEEES